MTTAGISAAYENQLGAGTASITDEVSRNDLMRGGYGVVTSNNIEMMLEAFRMEEMQYFTDHTRNGNAYKKSRVIRHP